jgi:hypothetical protein
MIWKNLRKKNETEIQNTMEGHSKQRTESQNLTMKWKLKEKLNSSKPVKGICKNSPNPSDQT